MYEGPERRQDYGKIAVLEERVNNWMNTTTDYRRSLCEKIDELRAGQKEMNIALGRLPCGERKGWYNSTNRQIAFMWVMIMLLTTTGVGLGKMVMELNSKVEKVSQKQQNVQLDRTVVK